MKAAPFIWTIDVFVSRRVGNVELFALKKRLSIGDRSMQGAAMSNHAPLHSIEIVFYSAASFFAIAGLAWFFLR
jgi:hypothetical protein